MPGRALFSFVVTGLATFSARMESQMREDLDAMVRKSEKAGALSLRVDGLHHDAKVRIDDSIKKEEEAQGLENDAKVLRQRSEDEFATASTETAEAERLHEQAAAEAADEEGALEAAGLDETAYEADLVIVSEESGTAAELELEAHADEAAIGLCEFIPLVDIVCDVVGGATAVGLEIAAGEATVQAVTEGAAAAVLYDQEQGELATAASLEIDVVRDEGLADTAADSAADATVNAEKDAADAQVDEALASDRKREAGIDVAQADADETAVVADEEEISSLMAEVAAHGVGAFLRGMAANISGAIALLCCAMSTVVRTYRSMFGSQPIAAMEASSPGTGRISLLLGVLYCGSHVLCLLAACSFVSRKFIETPSINLQSRGGLILYSCFCAALAYSTTVHCIARIGPFRTLSAIPMAVFESWLYLAVHFLLFTMEIILAWLYVGVDTMSHMGTWQLFAVPCLLVITIYILVTYHGRVVEESVRYNSLPTESTALLTVIENQHDQSEHISTWKAFQRVWSENGKARTMVSVAYDIFVFSLMLALLLHCVPVIVNTYKYMHGPMTALWNSTSNAWNTVCERIHGMVKR